MIFRSYLPHSAGYTNYSSLTKFPGVDSGFKLSGTTTSPFHDLSSVISDTSLISFPKFSVGSGLPEIIKTSPYVLPNPIEYPQNWEFVPKDSETEKPSYIETVTDPIHNWLKGTTTEDIFNFILENAYDAYEIFTDIHDTLKAQSYGYNPNDTFYNTSASEQFNGGIGNDTVIYLGKHSDYQIVAILEYPLGNHLGYKVIGNDGKEIDTLINIEQVEFSDGHTDLSIIGSSAIFHSLI